MFGHGVAGSVTRMADGDEREGGGRLAGDTCEMPQRTKRWPWCFGGRKHPVLTLPPGEGAAIYCVNPGQFSQAACMIRLISDTSNQKFLVSHKAVC